MSIVKGPSYFPAIDWFDLEVLQPAITVCIVIDLDTILVDL